ncbi:hypothetical protein KY495_15565 [Massilia sp. PAMC28688]|uniref:hypothetical protein n=1 Tax=Massilia sp. PAMC28688 TaxID=2861283 RepID=UPI001C62EE39|nr:hypothetical protein [Massilia sp. PAMC28688]QYF92174.1 hypothetical protein KY495_15565 [Massilia sp. PAMC28688]
MLVKILSMMVDEELSRESTAGAPGRRSSVRSPQAGHPGARPSAVSSVEYAFL